MQVLFRLFLKILLLKQGPQDIPYSKGLTFFLLVLHMLTGLMLLGLSQTFSQALYSALTSTVIMVAFVQIMLITHRKDIRLLQTLSALAGVEILLGLFSIPLTMLYQNGISDPLVIGMLSLTIIGWNGMVAGHIFTHALGNNRALGFSYAAFYLFVAIIFSSTMSV
jgi:hypothetical protein